MCKIFSTLLLLSLGLNLSSPQIIIVDAKETHSDYIGTDAINTINEDGIYLIEGNTLSIVSPPSSPTANHGEQTFLRVHNPPQKGTVKKEVVTLTAFSSTIFQCDENPFRTASGTYVRDGIVATNFLPFGTKIKIQEIFGDKIFVVEDRMSRRYWRTVDIWMPDYKSAINFGRKHTEIEILD